MGLPATSGHESSIVARVPRADMLSDVLCNVRLRGAG